MPADNIGGFIPGEVPIRSESELYLDLSDCIVLERNTMLAEPFTDFKTVRLR
jgi:hypothetical protein